MTHLARRAGLHRCAQVAPLGDTGRVPTPPPAYEATVAPSPPPAYDVAISVMDMGVPAPASGPAPMTDDFVLPRLVSAPVPAPVPALAPAQPSQRLGSFRRKWTKIKTAITRPLAEREAECEAECEAALFFAFQAAFQQERTVQLQKQEEIRIEFIFKSRLLNEGRAARLRHNVVSGHRYDIQFANMRDECHERADAAAREGAIRLARLLGRPLHEAEYVHASTWAANDPDDMYGINTLSASPAAGERVRHAVFGIRWQW